jgi:DNA-binding response OmpR family regulator
MSRVLVIDDEAYIREELRHGLESAGFAVEEASDGRDGLKLVQRAPPDLVITDILMSDIDGIQTIREIKAHSPGVKIIAMSGGGSGHFSDYLVWAKKLGADAIFMKPIDLAELLYEVCDLAVGGRTQSPTTGSEIG